MPATVQLGSQGDDVKRVQRVLRRMDLVEPYGNISGTFDAETDTGVRIFQQGAGLVVDGIVGPVTWSHLPAYREASPTLQNGSLGPDVGWLQQVLAGSAIAIQFAGYGGPIDGIFGPQTEAAVRDLQSWAGVVVDGVVGDQTWFVLMTPGSAQHLTVEAAAGLLDRLNP